MNARSSPQARMSGLSATSVAAFFLASRLCLRRRLERLYLAGCTLVWQAAETCDCA
jgi:hypothetical protein